MKRKRSIQMKKIQMRLFKLACIFTLVLVSCNQSGDSRQESTDATVADNRPKPLTFTEEKEIKWEVMDMDTMPPPKSSYLDLNRLPTRPFDMLQFQSLKQPMEDHPLKWNQISWLPVHKDSIHSLPFEVTSNRIPNPEIKEIDNPITQQDLKAGFVTLSISEGLPETTVHAIVSDGSTGHWLSTPNYLCHFDGERLHIYPYRSIKSILVDKKGWIWTVSDKNGIHILNMEENTSYHYPSDENFLEIIQDHNDHIWMVSSSNSGIFQIDINSSSIKEFHLDVGQCVTLLEDDNYNIWVGTSSDIMVIKEDRTQYKLLEIDEFDINYISDLYEDSKGQIWAMNYFGGNIAKISLANDQVSYLWEFKGSTVNQGKFIEGPFGNIIISRSGELCILNQDQSQIKKIPIQAAVTGSWLLPTLHLDEYGVLWMATIGRGLFLVDFYGLDIQYLDESNGLTSGEIWEITEVSSGEIWIGHDHGIDIISKDKNQISTIGLELLKNDNSNVSQIQLIKEMKNGHLFVMAGFGFNIIDPKQNKITRYSIDQHFTSSVHDFLEDDKGNYWMTTVQGLFKMNIQNHQLLFINGRENQIPGNSVHKIIEDVNSLYWLATPNGLVIIDHEKNTIKYLTEEEGLIHNNVSELEIDDYGQLWVATMNGFSVIDIKNQAIQNYGLERLHYSELFDLVEGENHMYLGSVDGLILLDKNNLDSLGSNVRHFGSSQGFLRNDYHQDAGMRSKDGSVWMVASPDPKGVIIKDQNTWRHVKNKVEITGITILNESFRYKISQFSASDSQLIKLNSIRPQVTNGNSNLKWTGLKGPFSLPEGLQLPHDHNSLSFSFSTDKIFHQDKIKYKYLLVGKDKNWSNESHLSETPKYYNLIPGEYTFKVVSSSGNGQWSNPATLSFEILPPWWQTWWAYLLYVISLIGLISLVAHFRSKILKEKNRQLEKTVDERTKKLQNTIKDLQETQAQLVHSEKMASLGELTAGIAHEIQNPLNFVNNFSEVSEEMIEEVEEELQKGDLEETKEILQDLKGNLVKISHHGKRASGIVRSMLDHSRTSSGEKVETDINDLCDEYLRLAYHGMRARDRSFNTDFELNLDPDLPKIKVIPQDIGRVLLNLINNAFQACAENREARIEKREMGKVIVSTKAPSSQEGVRGVQKSSPLQGGSEGIQITIADNGPGIPDDIKDKIFQPFFTTKPTGQGTGLGLSLSYDIVKAHGGTIEVESNPESGTIFKISLPIQEKQVK